MIFQSIKKPERVDHRRPCEVNGSKAWYHGLVHSDKTIVQAGSNLSGTERVNIERAVKMGLIIPSEHRLCVVRQTFAMIEYLDGSVSKVDPEKVHFIDV